MNRRPGLRALVVALALGLVVAACGDSDDDDSSAGGEASGTEAGQESETTEGEGAEGDTDAGSDGGPVTIEHAFGETTIEGRPETIVSLSSQWTDVLLAMGVQPVGHLSDELAGDDGTFPWQSDLSSDSTPIVAVDQVPMEQVASLRPDLILVSYLAAEESVYEDLSALAPTIGMLGERDVDRWQDMTEVAGQFLDDPERAEEVTAEVEGLVEETAAELPGLEGRTFSMANYVPGDMIYVVADEEDGSSVFFQQLGMELDPEIQEARGEAARAEISPEQAEMLDADLLVMFANDGDPADLVGYEDLPSVRNDGVIEMGYEEVVGLNTPSPLSIPFALDIVRPTLETVAGG